MNILLTGSSGFIGSSLVPFLTARGHAVSRLVRRSPQSGEREIFWDPDAGRLDAVALEGFDAAVHLAGESIAAGRWTDRRRRSIRNSRVVGTALLAGKLAGLRQPPSVMVSASAIGFYGNRGSQILREDSGPGTGFLADVCRAWEESAGTVQGGGTRLIVVRTGLVLSTSGGALPRMLPLFRIGAGGRLGDGRQFMSWIALEDLLEIILFACATPSLRGAVNAVAPEPVTNRAFTKILGRVLGRPAMLPVPAAAIRLIFGAMGEQTLLSSARVVPARLQEAGFEFHYPELAAALRHALCT
jgi:uncharacterized protein